MSIILQIIIYFFRLMPIQTSPRGGWTSELPQKPLFPNTFLQKPLVLSREFSRVSQMHDTIGMFTSVHFEPAQYWLRFIFRSGFVYINNINEILDLDRRCDPSLRSSPLLQFRRSWLRYRGRLMKTSFVLNRVTITWTSTITTVATHGTRICAKIPSGFGPWTITFSSYSTGSLFTFESSTGLWCTSYDHFSSNTVSCTRLPGISFFVNNTRS